MMDGKSITQKFLGRNKGWEYKFTVKGTWPFPHDMLRYDACKAASVADQDLIDKLADNGVDHLTLEELTKPVEIKMVMVGYRGPTEGRWRSFCWRVL